MRRPTTALAARRRHSFVIPAMAPRFDSQGDPRLHLKGSGPPAFERAHRRLDVQEVDVAKIVLSSQAAREPPGAARRAGGSRRARRRRLRPRARPPRRARERGAAARSSASRTALRRKLAIGVRRVDGIRQRSRVAVGAQRLGRNAEEGPREIEAGRQRPPAAHAAQTGRTGAAQQREQIRFRSDLRRGAPSRRRRSRAASPRRPARRSAPRADAARRAPRHRARRRRAESRTAPRPAAATHSSCHADARTP